MVQQAAYPLGSVLRTATAQTKEDSSVESQPAGGKMEQKAAKKAVCNRALGFGPHINSSSQGQKQQFGLLMVFWSTVYHTVIASFLEMVWMRWRPRKHLEFLEKATSDSHIIASTRE